MLKKEAAYFGDIVILPFMDRYELVVLKTVAICEFGVSSNLLAAYNCFPFYSFGSWIFFWLFSLIYKLIFICADSECDCCIYYEM